MRDDERANSSATATRGGGWTRSAGTRRPATRPWSGPRADGQLREAHPDLGDDVTAVAGWVPVVKELRDNTQLAGDAAVLTGSSAADLDEARCSLGAGRTEGATPFRLLLPMTFRDYPVTTAVEVPLQIR